MIVKILTHAPFGVAKAEQPKLTAESVSLGQTPSVNASKLSWIFQTHRTITLVLIDDFTAFFCTRFKCAPFMMVVHKKCIDLFHHQMYIPIFWIYFVFILRSLSFFHNGRKALVLFLVEKIQNIWRCDCIHTFWARIKVQILMKMRLYAKDKITKLNH